MTHVRCIVHSGSTTVPANFISIHGDKEFLIETDQRRREADYLSCSIKYLLLGEAVIEFQTSFGHHFRTFPKRCCWVLFVACRHDVLRCWTRTGLIRVKTVRALCLEEDEEWRQKRSPMYIYIKIDLSLRPFHHTFDSLHQPGTETRTHLPTLSHSGAGNLPSPSRRMLTKCILLFAFSALSMARRDCVIGGTLEMASADNRKSRSLYSIDHRNSPRWNDGENRFDAASYNSFSVTL